jgi:hypothetical protein
MFAATCLVSVTLTKRLDCATEEEATAMLKTSLQAATGQLAAAFAEALTADGYTASIQPEYITFRPVASA